MLLALTLVAVLQAPPDTTAAAAASPETMAEAYLDSAAAAMVSRARSRTAEGNARIEAYEMIAKERGEVGVRGLRRDRVLFRQEVAFRIRWEKGGEKQITALGGRMAVPLFLPRVRRSSDSDLVSRGAELAFDPAREWNISLLFGDLGDLDDDDESHEIVHPLTSGSETRYRFRSGETTTIRLASGRAIRLLELQVIPRRADSSLLNGSLWLEAGTYSPVRGVFALAAPIQFLSESGDRVIPTVDASFELSYVTLEYGLWEDEWWLPRLFALEGKAVMGRWTVPLVWERSFEDYRVYGRGEPIPPAEPIDTTLFRMTTVCEGAGCARPEVAVPRDSLRLVHREHLPGSIFDSDRLMTSRELDELASILEGSLGRPLRLLAPRVTWRAFDGSLVHYNRVEGLTIGTSARVELAARQIEGAAWIGTADLSPAFRVDARRTRLRGGEGLSLYRRIEAFIPEDHPFSLGNSISGFAFGRDDGDYYRSVGVSLHAERERGRGARLHGRLYAERQRPVEKRTDASLAHWLGDGAFRPNPAVDPADQLGAEVRIRASHGWNPRGLRATLETSVDAEIGTFRFARPSARLFTTFPLVPRLMGALEAGGGTSFGTLPVQRQWYLGGSSTVRGFRPEDRVAGESFWWGRGEIGTDHPTLRLILFSDAGWAGERHAWRLDPQLVSAGAGVSLLDGLLRADFARALCGGTERWNFRLSLDAPL